MSLLFLFMEEREEYHRSLRITLAPWPSYSAYLQSLPYHISFLWWHKWLLLAWWLKTRTTYSLTVLKARSLKARCLQGYTGSKASRGGFLLTSSSFWWLQMFFVCLFFCFFGLWLYHSGLYLYDHFASFSSLCVSYRMLSFDLGPPG